MLVSFTIFHKGGLILYQHSPDLQEDEATSSNTISDSINTWLSKVYLNPTKSLTDRKAIIDGHPTKMVVEWQEENDFIGLALYPDIRRGDENLWIGPLLKATLQEFQVFWSIQQNQQEQQELLNNNDTTTACANSQFIRPMDTTPFDGTFQVLFKQYKDSTTGVASTTTSTTTKVSNKAKSKGKNSGKEKRHWHDGKAKVTKEAMDELDFSKNNNASSDDNDGDDNAQPIDKDAIALAEARAAYLPTKDDLAAALDETSQFNHPLVDDDDLDSEEEASSSSSSTWGNSLKGLFQQMTGQKVLTKQDLEAPLVEMHKLLTSKNVASSIARHICDNVESSLVGKKLNSMYYVKTAVRQALERAINKLLLPSMQLDLLRQVVSKRDALFGSKRPYVIVVVGINGVGKSTSLAKLAYYLKSNGCKPLLAACDTFRSGAVEQLSVHARCLELPIFHQGYSKDPSNVAKAAIEQATKNGNDVVLVDTAGRMQNNVPLMKALGRLAAENQPDMVVFVGEALVGNDGVDQVRMFNQAVSSIQSNQKVNAILLTKFDTVSDKVGAALTMTHVTNAPILFVGTGQKYHHVQKLSTSAVIRSLFS